VTGLAFVPLGVSRDPGDKRLSDRYQIEAERLDSKPGDSRPEGLS